MIIELTSDSKGFLRQMFDPENDLVNKIVMFIEAKLSLIKVFYSFDGFYSLEALLEYDDLTNIELGEMHSLVRIK